MEKVTDIGMIFTELNNMITVPVTEAWLRCFVICPPGCTTFLP